MTLREVAVEGRSGRLQLPAGDEVLERGQPVVLEVLTEGLLGRCDVDAVVE